MWKPLAFIGQHGLEHSGYSEGSLEGFQCKPTLLGMQDSGHHCSDWHDGGLSPCQQHLTLCPVLTWSNCESMQLPLCCACLLVYRKQFLPSNLEASLSYSWVFMDWSRWRVVEVVSYPHPHHPLPKWICNHSSQVKTISPKQCHHVQIIIGFVSLL